MKYGMNMLLWSGDVTAPKFPALFDAVLKETLRMYSALPATLPRVVPPSTTTDMISGGRNGRVVEGKFIPAGKAHR